MGKAKGSEGTGIRVIPKDWALRAQVWSNSEMIAPVATLHWIMISKASVGS